MMLKYQTYGPWEWGKARRAGRHSGSDDQIDLANPAVLSTCQAPTSVGEGKNPRLVGVECPLE